MKLNKTGKKNPNQNEPLFFVNTVFILKNLIEIMKFRCSLCAVKVTYRKFNRIIENSLKAISLEKLTREALEMRKPNF